MVPLRSLLQQARYDLDFLNPHKGNGLIPDEELIKLFAESVDFAESVEVVR